ncbi:MAG TPA: RNA polymerase sigma factor [Verrucomicrobiales bacterium]|nr:RNA polymerase sigma factor [Verrucomicrobiales bacterium]
MRPAAPNVALPSVAALAQDDAASSNARGNDAIRSLTLGIHRGDEAAYRLFYHHFHHRLARYCLALTAGDSAEADDVLQKTYLRIARSLGPLPDEAALWRWLTKAARCAAIDASRKRCRYRSLLSRWTHWWKVNGRNAHEPSCGSRDPLLQALSTALAALPEDSRALVQAKYFDGLTVSRIAAGCGLTEKAVERKLARARALLRASIQSQIHPCGP